MSCDPGARTCAARRRPGGVVQWPPAVRPDADCPAGRVTLERGRSPRSTPARKLPRESGSPAPCAAGCRAGPPRARQGPACRSPCTGEPARCSFRPRYGCAKKNDARPGNLPADRELLAVVRHARELLVRPQALAHRFARFPGRPAQGQQRERAVHQRQHGAPVTGARVAFPSRDFSSPGRMSTRPAARLPRARELRFLPGCRPVQRSAGLPSTRACIHPWLTVASRRRHPEIRSGLHCRVSFSSTSRHRGHLPGPRRAAAPGRQPVGLTVAAPARVADQAGRRAVAAELLPDSGVRRFSSGPGNVPGRSGDDSVWANLRFALTIA